MSAHFNRILATAISLAIAGLSTGVHAAGAQAESGSRLTVGAGLLAAPEYSGGSKHRVAPAIFADYQADNGFFASTYKGVGFAMQGEVVSVSAALAYEAGRREKKQAWFEGSNDLKGMGDIDGYGTANFGLGFKLPGNAMFNIETALALGSKKKGNVTSFRLDLPLYAGDQDQLMLSTSAKFGDSKHVQTWYGVTAEQSTKSGYKQFKAGAGFEEASASLVWMHQIDRNWSVRSSLGYVRVLPHVADSPIVKSKGAPAGMFTVNYSY